MYPSTILLCIQAEKTQQTTKMLSSIKLLKIQKKQTQLFSLLRQVIKTAQGILFLYGLICYLASEVEKSCHVLTANTSGNICIKMCFTYYSTS